MAIKPKDKETVVIGIKPVQKDNMTICIKGLSPLIYNRMSEKGRQEMLLPRGRLTEADKKVHLKHNPFEEYRASVYAYRDYIQVPGQTEKIAAPIRPTRLFFPAGAFKQAAATSVTDMPEAPTKASIKRLIWVEGRDIHIFGVPQLFMAMVRQAGISRTPDVRTRAILDKWACQISISFVADCGLKRADIVNMLTRAGLTVGIGDWRQEKGSGSFGQFEICNSNDPEFLAIVESGGRVVQDAGLEQAVPYDEETETLLGWFDDELKRRQRKLNGSESLLDGDNENDPSDETSTAEAEA